MAQPCLSGTSGTKASHTESTPSALRRSRREVPLQAREEVQTTENKHQLPPPLPLCPASSLQDPQEINPSFNIQVTRISDSTYSDEEESAWPPKRPFSVGFPSKERNQKKKSHLDHRKTQRRPEPRPEPNQTPARNPDQNFQ